MTRRPELDAPHSYPSTRLVHLHRQIFESVTLGARIGHRRRASSDGPSDGGVTVREREVTQLLAEGKSSKEVASLLNLSTKTVETHRQSLKRKYGIQNERRRKAVVATQERPVGGYDLIAI